MSKIKFLEELKYSKFVCFHPFKGFWDLKNSGIGTVRTATFIILLLGIITVMRYQLTGFIFNNNNILETNVFFVFSSVVLPFLIWVVANWSITTLVEGEGKLRDIYITTAYALVPYIVTSLVLLILSNVMVMNESSIYSLIEAIGLIWSAFLVIIGMMTIHQFFVGKTVITIFLAFLTMVIIVFAVLMFFSIFQQMVNFVLLIMYEVSQ